MAGVYTHGYLFLKHTSDTVKLAFDVAVEQYGGDTNQYPQQVTRSAAGSLLIVDSAVIKKQFVGVVFLDNDATGTVSYGGETFTKGCPEHLEACMRKTDLKVLRETDSTFWNGWIMNQEFKPIAAYDTAGHLRIVPIHIEEK